MKALKVEPGMLPVEVDIPNTLKAFQQAVDGCIETCLLDKSTVAVFCEEGKLLGKKPCLPIIGDIIVGTVILVRNAGEDFASLAPEQLTLWKQLLSQPEVRGCLALEDGSLWDELSGEGRNHENNN